MNSILAKLRALVGELKRRHVYHVAAVYGVTAFVVLQVADMVFPALLLPDWAFRLLVALTILGFPLALILAWAFDLTPQGLERSGPVNTPAPEDGGPSPRSSSPARAVALLLAAAVVGVAVAYGLLRSRQDPPAPDVDPGVLAVLPFRVTGAEPSLAYLREGIVDLMAAKLIGDVGPRAVDPRSTLSAWRRSVDADGEEDLAPEPALRLAQRLGAGQLMLGEVVSAPGQVAISVVIREVPGGRERHRLSRKSPADSLLVLVDELVAELLAHEAGGVRPIPSSTRSLPAMRAYLAGVAAYRRGAYKEAVEQHEVALAVDSTFALAALAQVMATWWGGPADERFERVLARAWDLRDRLGPREQASLLVYSGPAYPRPPTTAEILAASQRVVEIAPDQPEAWFELGDALFHARGVIRSGDPWPRAAQAFERAVQLDPDFVAPLAHLLELFSATSDTAGVRRARDLYLARDSTGEISHYVRWRAALALQDGIALRALRDRVGDAPTSSLARLVAIAQVDGIGLDDAERAAAVLRARRARDPGPPPELVQQLLALALNRGRPDEAVELLGDLGRRRDPTIGLQAAILHALYWDGDPATAATAADELERAVRAGDADTRSDAVCALEQWRVHRGASRDATGAIRELRRSDNAGHTFCADLLEVMGERGRAGADAVRVLERMDSLLWDATPSFAKWGRPGLPPYANLAVAREFAVRGDLNRALIAVRRRPYNWTLTPFYLSSYLREEARLAMEVGDEAGAQQALAHLELLQPGAGRMLTRTRGIPSAPR